MAVERSDERAVERAVLHAGWLRVHVPGGPPRPVATRAGGPKSGARRSKLLDPLGPSETRARVQYPQRFRAGDLVDLPGRQVAWVKGTSATHVFLLRLAVPGAEPVAAKAGFHLTISGAWTGPGKTLSRNGRKGTEA